MIGATLGHYKIIEKIGAGGMGEVFRATDARLGRDVAIKILPEAFARDPERLARFDQEARLLAALNHPNIAAIYGLEEAQDIGAGRTGPSGAGLGRIQFLVLELVPGETLAERIGRGAIPVEEALGVCRQIAEALEAAHERGIIHRDLKPANVKVTPEGKVKVLDFGLAKAFAPEGEAMRAASPGGGVSPGRPGSPPEAFSQSPTLTFGATRSGVILGTASYMSPEQARGKPVDKRTDIWSFGCVLYEALTGRQAFAGETISDTIANILKRGPDWGALPSDAPAGVGRVLRRCLEKEPGRRLRDIGDVRIWVEEAIAEPADSALGVGCDERPRWRRLNGPWIAAGVMGLIAAAAIGLATRVGSRASMRGEKPMTRFAIQLPPGEALAAVWELALSPDGRRLLYHVGGEGRNLYLREMDRLESKTIPGTAGGTQPFFSPDGEWIGFFAGGKLKKAPISGGSPLTLGNSDDTGGGSWGEDGTILFVPAFGSGIFKVPSSGGTPEAVTTVDLKKGERAHLQPRFLPGGRAAIFWIWTGGTVEGSRAAVVSIDTGERRDLLQGAGMVRYASTGHLVYGGTAGLMAVRFDLNRLTTVGEPFTVAEKVFQSIFGLRFFEISQSGTLAFVPAIEGQVPRELVWVNRAGESSPVTKSRRGYSGLRLSPDGRRLAVAVFGEMHVDVWVYEFARDTFTRLTLGGTNFISSWTPDGKRVVFNSPRQGPYNLYWQPADGGGEAEPLAPSEHAQEGVTSWSPDGRALAYTEFHPETGGDLMLTTPGDHREPQEFLATPFNEHEAEFSPDGRFLAYSSDQSGRREIYVRELAGSGRTWQISGDGGREPKWARSGRELFYRQENRLMVVPISMRPTFSAQKPKLLFEARFPWAESSLSYDVTADGQRFVMIRATEEEVSPSQIHVVQNWSETLKRREAGNQD